MCASVSTVGYGDYSPSNTLSRWFTAAYILSGVTVVFSIFGDAMAAFLTKMEAIVSVEAWSAHNNPYIAPWRFYLNDLGFTILFGTCSFLFVSAAILTALQEGLSYGDAFWHCFITSTTVGYGDVYLETQGARAFASLHIVLSVSWLAALIALTQEVLMDVAIFLILHHYGLLDSNQLDLTFLQLTAMSCCRCLQLGHIAAKVPAAEVGPRVGAAGSRPHQQARAHGRRRRGQG